MRPSLFVGFSLTVLTASSANVSAHTRRAGSGDRGVPSPEPDDRPVSRGREIALAALNGDLRYGNLLDEDWEGRDRFARGPDTRRPVPLPKGVACYAIAATTAASPGAVKDLLLGDGLVPVASALGRHKDPCAGAEIPARPAMDRLRVPCLGRFQPLPPPQPRSPRKRRYHADRRAPRRSGHAQRDTRTRSTRQRSRARGHRTANPADADSQFRRRAHHCRTHRCQPPAAVRLNAAERRGVVIRIVLDPREHYDFVELGDLADNVRIKRGGPLMHLKAYLAQADRAIWETEFWRRGFKLMVIVT